MLRKLITAVSLTLGLTVAALSPAEARISFGGGFHGGSGGFHGGRFHPAIAGFRGGLHPGFNRFRHGFHRGFAEGLFHGRWGGGWRHGLSAVGVGLVLAPFIQARISSYFDSYQDRQSSDGGYSSGISTCDAQCIVARYQRIAAKAQTAPVAKAADIPAYDVSRNCSTLQGAPSRNYCLKAEQENYDLIKSLWSYVPDEVRGQTLKTMDDILRGRPAATHAYTTMKGYLMAYLHRDELTRTPEAFHN